METIYICPNCKKTLPPNAPKGLCPECLLREAMALEPKPVTPAQPTVPPPSIAQLAPLFPQLEILELLGQGGMGMVYKARQPQLDRFVALKLLSPELAKDPAFAERFSREAKALAKLNHPNIVSVYDFGTAGGYYFFVMEFVDGMNLSQLEKSRKLTPEEALSIIPKICDALQFAHDEGVVHRDIKPANILIDKKGRVKIADFGLSKLVGKEAHDFTLTLSRMAMGTPHYMSPEQLEDSGKVDHRADIFSLGVVFYEMLTGQLPLGRFPLPSEKVQVDVRFDEVVLRSMERDVERRYQHVSEVKQGVESLTGKPQAGSPLQPGTAEMEIEKSSASIPVWLRKPALLGYELMAFLLFLLGAYIGGHSAIDHADVGLGANNPWLTAKVITTSPAGNFSGGYSSGWDFHPLTISFACLMLALAAFARYQTVARRLSAARPERRTFWVKLCAVGIFTISLGFFVYSDFYNKAIVGKNLAFYRKVAVELHSPAGTRPHYNADLICVRADGRELTRINLGNQMLTPPDEAQPSATSTFKGEFELTLAAAYKGFYTSTGSLRDFYNVKMELGERASKTEVSPGVNYDGKPQVIFKGPTVSLLVVPAEMKFEQLPTSLRIEVTGREQNSQSPASTLPGRKPHFPARLIFYPPDGRKAFPIAVPTEALDTTEYYPRNSTKAVLEHGKGKTMIVVRLEYRPDNANPVDTYAVVCQFNGLDGKQSDGDAHCVYVGTEQTIFDSAAGKLVIRPAEANKQP